MSLVCIKNFSLSLVFKDIEFSFTSEAFSNKEYLTSNLYTVCIPKKKVFHFQLSLTDKIYKVFHLVESLV